MRVYYFGIYDTQGGMENYAMNLICGIKRKHPDVDFTLLVFGSSFSGKEVYEENGLCDIAVLPDYKRQPSAFTEALRKLGENADATDVFQLNVCTFRNYLLFSAVSKAKCRKIIVSHYSKNDDGLAALHYINRAVFHKKFENVAVSDVSGRFMFKKDYEVIPNGVVSGNYAFHKEHRDEIRARYHISEHTFLIGQVARIAKEKNQAFSVKVMKALCDLHKDVKLMLVGKQSDDEAEKLIAEYGLADKVILTGPIYKDIGRFYSAFDCFILPSLNEAMPISLVEALCNGLPVLHSKNVPPLPLLDNAAIPELSSLELNVDLWVERILKCMDAPARTRTNYIAGTGYDIDHFIDRYYALYTGTPTEAAVAAKRA